MRHIHREGYVSLVLSGGFEEAGDRGRFRVAPGQVLVHAPLEGHCDRYFDKGAEVLNLCIEQRLTPAIAVMSSADPDVVVRLAENDPKEAVALLMHSWRPAPPPAPDWPEMLARDIARNPGLKLRHWARNHGLADATISRGFRQIFAISPSGFRAQLRARLALEEITFSRDKLSSIAARFGFSDQSHMTHSIQAMTGVSPRSWRRSVK